MTSGSDAEQRIRELAGIAAMHNDIEPCIRAAWREATEAERLRAALIVEPDHRDDDPWRSGWVRWGAVNAILRQRAAAIREQP